MNNDKLKKQLKMYLTDSVHITNLKKAVILDILDKDEIKPYIKDVLQYGCQSGTVTSLIYYNDTHKFALEHFNDIVDMYQCLADDLGRESMINPMLEANPLNWIAWFGYEETIRELANELELEV